MLRAQPRAPSVHLIISLLQKVLLVPLALIPGLQLLFIVVIHPASLMPDAVPWAQSSDVSLEQLALTPRVTSHCMSVSQHFCPVQPSPHNVCIRS